MDAVTVEAREMKIVSEHQSDMDVFAKLPDELLSCIFEIVHETDAEDYCTPAYEPINLTCQRFRSVALRTPKLWNTLRYVAEGGPNYRAGPHQRQTLLSRSGQCGLLIYIQYDYSGITSITDIADFLKALSPHYSRWQELHVTIAKGLVEEAFNSMAAILKTFDTQSLNTLNVLTVQFYAVDEELDDTDAELEQVCAEFQQIFKASNLRTLRAENFVPNLTGDSWASLTSLSIELAAYYFEDGYFTNAFDPKAFFLALQTACGLRSLSISLHEARFNVLSKYMVSRIVFPCLKKFQFTAENCDYHTIRNVLCYVHFPVLEEYNIVVSVLGHYNDERWIGSLDYLFPEHESYGNLTRLSLRVDTSCAHYANCPIDPIFTRCKRLEHLELLGTGLLPVRYPLSASLPPLKSLTLERCPNMHFRFLDGFLTTLRSQKIQLETLDILDCDSLPNGYMIPGVRCNWKHWYKVTPQ